ncbi:MAG: 16S rRNA (cytidine(1402)-2'-O)-methyltransferase [Candidatus Limnocylindrales bacterium]
MSDEREWEPAVPERRSGGGTLYLVATPIGNLADVTLRALDVLRVVPLIAAEDTRIARRLLGRHEIRTRLTSFHARSGPGRLAELIEHLRAGADLALVTDAGTPGVSDPGDDLVRAWVGAGGLVVPVPGPSAVLAALVASGVAGPRWSFEGFLPRSGRARRDRLARIAADERATIVFEAPGRVAATLADLASACGPDRTAATCRELTKLHEEVVRGTLGGLAAASAGGDMTLRGEFVIVVGDAVGGSTARDGDSSPDRADELAAARAEMGRLIDAGLARGEAARRAAAMYGVPRRALYDAPDRPGGSPP